MVLMFWCILHIDLQLMLIFRLLYIEYYCVSIVMCIRAKLSTFLKPNPNQFKKYQFNPKYLIFQTTTTIILQMIVVPIM